MFGYMTEMDYIEMTGMKEMEATGDDLQGLLFHFLDEWLFLFSAEPFFIPRKIVITEFDLENFKICAKGYREAPSGDGSQGYYIFSDAGLQRCRKKPARDFR